MGQLSKKSDSSDIKKYFEAICNLQASGKEYPVSLEDVWPLVYANKHKAIEALKNSDLFVKDADYQVFTRSGEKAKGGRPSGEYWLSISCMEFFIARKKREVFEVYRQVFHKAMNPVMSESDALHTKIRLKFDYLKSLYHLCNVTLHIGVASEQVSKDERSISGSHNPFIYLCDMCGVTTLDYVGSLFLSII